MSGELGPGDLAPSQQEALDQYTQVTNQDAKDAIALLQRSEWNVQIAIAKFFDGEGPDPVAEAMAAQPPPASSARLENLQESLHETPRSSRRTGEPRPDPAPRIVPRPNNVHRPPFLISIFLTPFTLGYRVFTAGIRLALYILTFLPQPLRPGLLTNGLGMTTGFRNTNGRRMLMPKDTASRFKREFEEEYGANELPWFEGGFAQAQDLAKKELKFLLFVLVSPEHDDTESFTRETLLAPEVVSFIRDPANNIVLWGGNVLDSEAYQVSTEYNCTKFPFSGLVCLTPKHGSTRMGTIKRLVGPVPPGKYVSEIRSAMERYAAELAAVRSERVARDAVRNLRSEQDSAYERSLATDRERARRRREEQAAAAEAERRAAQEAEDEARKAELKRQWKLWRASTMETEPEHGAPGSVRVAIKLPGRLGGQRVVRRFSDKATLEELYGFVECHHLDEPVSGLDGMSEVPEKPKGYVHEYEFAIASILPRVVFEPSETDTVRAAIGAGANLIVEDFRDDDGGATMVVDEDDE